MSAITEKDILVQDILIKIEHVGKNGMCFLYSLTVKQLEGLFKCISKLNSYGGSE